MYKKQNRLNGLCGRVPAYNSDRAEFKPYYCQNKNRKIKIIHIKKHFLTIGVCLVLLDKASCVPQTVLELYSPVTAS
jgi:hypothetical protein